ncbi:DUF5671 domain-containing protein [Paracoccus shandongensis]|uniref:DUF5671 domain-containing protein n=1 Tax=Paracoccus shandongensis TaxID=2816048 RepID=UPI001A8D544D|nr:DUF5671 domain-containing protein [Paracoccus shandongensis]
MAAAEQLSDFVRDALAAGHDGLRIRAALQGAGWTAPEIEGAMTAWQDGGGLPPVPRPRPYVSAREAMLYALLMIALVLVCFHVISLGFRVIDLAIPDLAEAGPPDTWSMRFSIAAILAFLPLFVILDHRMARRIGGGEQRRRSQARRVFASITVLAAALVLLGDAVSVIYAFLSGDLTPRLAAKCALVAVMGLLVAACYREDLDG